MTLPLSMVTPSVAAQAYQTTDAAFADGSVSGIADASGFGAMLQHAAGDLVAAGRNADAQSMKAVTGNADVTDVVSAVSKAELALQTTVTIRDRVVQAYQDIMRMPI